MRLFTAVTSGVFFGFLLYLASTSLNWLTLTNGLLILIGVGGGLLLGWFEARIVTRGLSDNMQTVVWQIIPAGALMFGLPILFAKIFLANAEFLSFAGYLFLPAVPVFYAITGWRYLKFEKKNEVQIKMVSFGYLYYKEPIIVDSNRLYHFLGLVASKDSSALWQQTGYSGRLMAAIQQRQDIDPSTREELLDILKTMDKYRRIGLTVLLLFLISTFSALAIIFGDVFGLTRSLTANTINIIMPAFGVIMFSFFGAVLLLMRTFNTKISSMLTRIESGKLTQITHQN